jgi:hypothetical protein
MSSPQTLVNMPSLKLIFVALLLSVMVQVSFAEIGPSSENTAEVRTVVGESVGGLEGDGPTLDEKYPQYPNVLVGLLQELLDEFKY